MLLSEYFFPLFCLCIFLKMSTFNPCQVECYNRQWVLGIENLNFNKVTVKCVGNFLLKSQCLFSFLVHIDIKRAFPIIVRFSWL